MDGLTVLVDDKRRIEYSIARILLRRDMRRCAIIYKLGLPALRLEELSCRFFQNIVLICVVVSKVLSPSYNIQQVYFVL